MTWDLIKSLLSIKENLRNAPKQEQLWNDASAVEFKVREIVATELNKDVNDVTPETNAYDEGDSVGNLEILMFCEETFDIEIPDEDAEHLATVGHIVKYIQGKLDV
jgi:acyl carrier protein